MFFKSSNNFTAHFGAPGEIWHQTEKTSHSPKAFLSTLRFIATFGFLGHRVSHQ